MGFYTVIAVMLVPAFVMVLEVLGGVGFIGVAGVYEVVVYFYLLYLLFAMTWGGQVIEGHVRCL